MNAAAGTNYFVYFNLDNAQRLSELQMFNGAKVDFPLAIRIGDDFRTFTSEQLIELVTASADAESIVRKKIVQELRSSAFLHTDVNKEHVLLAIEHGGTEWHKYVTPPEKTYSVWRGGQEGDYENVPASELTASERTEFKVLPDDELEPLTPGLLAKLRAEVQS